MSASIKRSIRKIGLTTDQKRVAAFFLSQTYPDNQWLSLGKIKGFCSRKMDQVITYEEAEEIRKLLG